MPSMSWTGYIASSAIRLGVFWFGMDVYRAAKLAVIYINALRGGVGSGCRGKGKVLHFLSLNGV